MSKNLSIGMLLDFYGQMLTDKQAYVIDLYYNQDFSLAEIAEEMNISRQGVRDLIKRSEKQLFDMEGSLGLASRFSEISENIEKIQQSCKEIYDKINNDDLKSEIEKIIGLTEKIRTEV